MCFINRRNQPSAKVATEDIHVFKGLTVDKKGRLYAPVQKTRWRIGWTKWSWRMVKSGSPDEIYRGLHSAKTWQHANKYGDKIFNAVIPKGAKYWENDDEFVSNKLRIVGPFKHENLTP